MEKLTTKHHWKPHIINGMDELQDKVWDRVSNCLTGMRPSGRLHLGHYKGALENWLKMQEHPQINPYFLIADYQVLGDHLWDTDRLRQSVVDMVIDWLAVGLDPEESNFIVQSYVPEFAELFNYLTMFVPYSVATNNPTLKDEMKKIEARDDDNEEGASLGFINYPVSQVADILLPKGEIVPVGEDQIPHIELARRIIKKVNGMYGTDYPLPKVMLSETPRLVGTDGNDKMSKSLGNTIYLTASPEEIKSQVQSMYTDPWKVSVQSPWNIENHVVFKYLDIFYDDAEHIQTLKDRYVAWGENSVGDGELKRLLVDVLEKLIAPIREKRRFYEQNMELVINSIEQWSAQLRKEAQQMLRELREAMWVIDYWKEYLSK